MPAQAHCFMSSLAELPELVGFFSYSRSDDEHSGNALSVLRKRIHDELRLQLGRDVRLWQDTEAIPHGTLWEDRIRKAIAESAFFIPIVSPSAIRSSHCKFEFEAFLGRESELLRDDLVFPILYIRVPALENELQRRQDEVLKIIHARQYADWTKIRLDDAASPAVGKQVARFCEDIAEALRKPWGSPEERRRREEAEAEEARGIAQAEEERCRQEARQRERRDQVRRTAEDDAQRRAEAERRRREDTEAQQREQLRRDTEAHAERSHAAVKSGQGLAPPEKWWASKRASAAVGMLGVIIVGSVLAWFTILREPVSRPATHRPPDAITAVAMPAQPAPGEPVSTPSRQPSAEAITAAAAPAPPAPALVTPGATLVQPASGLIRPLSPERERALKPKDAFRDCNNCPEMVVVPSGSFTMGSPDGEKDRDSDEGPQRVVTIGRAFAVGKLHVTVDQFAAFVAETHYDAGSKCWTFESGKAEERSGRSWRNPGFVQEGSHPAVCVSWYDAKAYTEWLAKKTQRPYRMLTEAEWEYAARGRTEPGTYPRFWFGDSEKGLCRYGNGADQTARVSIEGAKGWTIAPCDDGYAYTSPAGHFEPNAFGLYDMFGNAWQWTADCYHDSYKGAPANGDAWTTGDCSSRVVRGGGWGHVPGLLRSALRRKVTAGLRNGGIGFRLARTLTP